MRILLIGNYVPDAQQSMQRYAAMLRDGLVAAGHEVRVITPTVKAAKLAQHESALKWLGYIDKMLLFPRELARAIRWADVTHICDHSNSVYTKSLEGRPHVVTCHDLLAVRSGLGEIPEQPTRWSGRVLQRLILNGLRRARHIVCDSQATGADVLRLAPERRNDVSVVYIGLNYPYRPMSSGESANRLGRLGLAEDQQFILHVGGNQWYKNRLGVMKIFTELRTRPEARHLVLVMAGKPWTAEMRQFAASHKLGSATIQLTDVAEEDLRALYSKAEVLLFPSLAEGFGWPILEAQACGCPVVTSNRAPMTEVGGDAAVYVDPLDYSGVANAVAAAINTRQSVGSACLKNAARFNSAAMIGAYQALYLRVLSAAA